LFFSLFSIGDAMSTLLNLCAESTPLEDFRRVCKNAPIEYINQIPNIETILLKSFGEHGYSGYSLGYLNEIEYSANIRCANVSFSSSDARILKNVRYYFENVQTLFINDEKLSTEFLHSDPKHKSDSCEMLNYAAISANVATRLDYNTNNELVDVTAKFKVASEKFIYNKCRYALTGSIEIPLPELMPHTNPPQKFHQRKYIRYWYMAIDLPGYICRDTGKISPSTSFKFRIAFRNQKSFDDNLVNQCNIECEDLITGIDFIKSFDLLFKYYKHMYIVQDKCMTPDFVYKESVADESFVKELSDEQKLMLKTLRYIEPDTQHDDGRDADLTTPEMRMFVKYLGFAAYRVYYPEQDTVDFLSHEQLSFEPNFNHDSAVDAIGSADNDGGNSDEINDIVIASRGDNAIDGTLGSCDFNTGSNIIANTNPVSNNSNNNDDVFDNILF